MSLEFSKPGDSIEKKPKLSKFGKIIFLVVGLVILLIIAIFIGNISSSNNQEEKEMELLDAINRSIDICQSSLITLDVDEEVTKEFETYKQAIANEPDILKKKDIAMEMIGFVSKYAEGNQSVTDELNGARNRISFAVDELES